MRENPRETRLCDLHVHSVFSDGTLTPEEIVDLAVRKGLSAVALTDHNTAKGCPRFVAAAEGKPLHAICGAEFTTEYEGTELHLLGLFLPQAVFDEVEAYTAERNARKEESNRLTICKLQEAGYRIAYDELTEAFPDVARNRSHIARLLVRKGCAATVEEAFQKLLNPECGFYTRFPEPDFLKTVARIKAWGGVAVWAHPLFHVSLEQAKQILPAAVAAGLDGAEAYYSTYTPEEQAAILRLTKQFGIAASGGSDFHGIVKPEIDLGCGKGDLAVPFTCYEALLARIR